MMAARQSLELTNHAPDLDSGKGMTWGNELRHAIGEERS